MNRFDILNGKELPPLPPPDPEKKDPVLSTDFLDRMQIYLATGYEQMWQGLPILRNELYLLITTPSGLSFRVPTSQMHSHSGRSRNGERTVEVHLNLPEEIGMAIVNELPSIRDRSFDTYRGPTVEPVDYGLSMAQRYTAQLQHADDYMGRLSSLSNTMLEEAGLPFMPPVPAPAPVRPTNESI